MTALLLAALAGHLVALAAYLARARRLGLALFVLGSLLTYVFLAREWLTIKAPPFSMMPHIMILLSGCALPAYALFVWRERLAWLAPWFAAVAAVPLLYAIFARRPAGWQPPPALRSPWWLPHVLAYLLSYSLAAIAFLLALTAIARPAARARFEDAAYRLLAFAFPLMTFGLVSGALWAEEAWGTYWSWDPKETWSLITWTLYIMYFHARKDSALRPYALPTQIVAFLALITTFLLVSFLPALASLLHSYT